MNGFVVVGKWHNHCVVVVLLVVWLNIKYTRFHSVPTLMQVCCGVTKPELSSNGDMPTFLCVCIGKVYIVW